MTCSKNAQATGYKNGDQLLLDDGKNEDIG